VAEKRLVAMAESAASACPRFPVKRAFLIKSAFAGAFFGKTAFPRGLAMRKSAFARRAIESTFARASVEPAFAGTAVKIPLAGMTPAKRGAERRLRKTRPVRGLSDQKIDLLLKKIQLLLHFLDQRNNIHVGLGWHGKILVFVDVFAHFTLAPFESWFLI
jgi:hypothetical protein